MQELEVYECSVKLKEPELAAVELVSLVLLGLYEHDHCQLHFVQTW